MKGHRELVSISVDASVGDALKMFTRHNLLAMPVYGQSHHSLPSGHKQYLGIVSILDIVMFVTYVASETDQQPTTVIQTDKAPDFPRPNPLHQADTLESISIRSVLGKSSESESLWTAKPNDRLGDAIEPLGKGIHRLLVPMPISETAGYHVLTQTDVTRFIINHVDEDPQLKQRVSMSLVDLGLCTPKNLLWVDPSIPLIDALKGMASWGVNAIPVVSGKQNSQRLLGTLSVSDLRMLPPRVDLYELIEEMKKLTVFEFLERVRSGEVGSNGGVVVKKNDTLLHVATLIVNSHVHRAWIVDDSGRVPIGVVTFSDIMRTILQTSH
ncbi:hypothetical protein SeMB42_g03841 [Synchytrium endobioticum]|nr:hypothetical protein SeMB42_g03841 [Synchytrium endobioticum]